MQTDFELSSDLKHLEEMNWKEVDGNLILTEGRDNGRGPLKVGVFFSGGPAPGGNNVIVGLYKALKVMHPESEVIGFLGGPKGLIEKQTKMITPESIASISGKGGFDFLGTGRTKIETEEQFAKAFKTIEELRLDGLVCIGGDDTNTNAYYLSEYLKERGSHCSIVGVPKTIDGDVKSNLVEASFGFDTATKIYSEMIGNICTDAASSLKYWHFIKLMGRSASHVALECALKTRPNIALISEEVDREKLSLETIVKSIADVVKERAKIGKNYGVILIPEGLIEYIPEIKVLIGELNRLLAKEKGIDELTKASRQVFDSLPKEVQNGLLLDRDPHGNVQVAKIETEKLLSEMVKKLVGSSFSAHHHYYGYEGRCGAPSIFDATYCFNLGYVAALLVHGRKSGYMAALKGLAHPVKEWRALGASLMKMMGEEERKGEVKKVIKKAYVDLKGAVFKKFTHARKKWQLEDAYQSPGPIQFYGPDKGLITKTLEIESGISSVCCFF